MHSRKPATDADHLINRLKTNWTALQSNPIVSNTQSMSAESFESAKNQLASTLQLALYLSPPERKMLQVICSIRDSDPAAFVEYIRATGQQHLSLITDGHTIAKALGIDSIVEIRWNKAMQTVSVLSTRAPRSAPPAGEVRSYSRAVAPTSILPRREPSTFPRKESVVSSPPSPPAAEPVMPPPTVMSAEPALRPIAHQDTPKQGRRERPRGGKKYNKSAAIPLMSSLAQDQIIASFQPPKETVATEVNTDLRNTSWDEPQ